MESMHFYLKSQSIHCHCCFSITTFYRSPMEWRRLCYQPCVSVCSQGTPYRALAPDILCKGLTPPAQGSPVPTYRAQLPCTGPCPLTGSDLFRLGLTAQGPPPQHTHLFTMQLVLSERRAAGICLKCLLVMNTSDCLWCIWNKICYFWGIGKLSIRIDQMSSM